MSTVIYITHHTDPVKLRMFNRCAQAFSMQIHAIYDKNAKSYTVKSSTLDFEGVLNLSELIELILTHCEPTSITALVEANLGEPGSQELSELFFQVVESLNPKHTIPFTSTPSCAELANEWYQVTQATQLPESSNITIKENNLIICLKLYTKIGLSSEAGASEPATAPPTSDENLFFKQNNKEAGAPEVEEATEENKQITKPKS